MLKTFLIDIDKMTMTAVNLDEKQLLTFITLSTDGKWLFVGGLGKRLLAIDTVSNSIEHEIDL